MNTVSGAEQLQTMARPFEEPNTLPPGVSLPVAVIAYTPVNELDMALAATDLPLERSTAAGMAAEAERAWDLHGRGAALGGGNLAIRALQDGTEAHLLKVSTGAMHTQLSREGSEAVAPLRDAILQERSALGRRGRVLSTLTGTALGACAGLGLGLVLMAAASEAHASKDASRAAAGVTTVAGTAMGGFAGTALGGAHSARFARRRAQAIVSKAQQQTTTA